MNEDDNTNENVLKKKVQYFFDNSIPVHIKYNQKYWKNGVIVSISSDFFMLSEFKEGLIPVFFQEIYNVDGYIR